MPSDPVEKEARESSEEAEVPPSEEEKSSVPEDSENNEPPQQIPPIPWSQVNFTFPQPYMRFGKGVAMEIPKAILKLLDPMVMHVQKALIERPKTMIVIGENSLYESGKLAQIQEVCTQNAIDTFVYSCGAGEATVTMVDEGVELALEEKPHYVVGIGGGSVLDTAKAIAGIYTNGGIAEDYHEGKPFELPGLPFIAVPTTSGTGSEITNTADLIDRVKGYKRSVKGDQIRANYILLDPELTLSCPPEVTAFSGVDAVVQAIEAYVSIHSHPLADIYAKQAIKLLSANLHKAVEHGEDFDARAEMMLGSFYAGIALSNVGLGLVHGLAHPIGYKYDIAHGKVCGLLLPWVIEYNIEYRTHKYAQVAKILSELDLFTKYEAEASEMDNARRLPSMLKELFSQVQIPLRLQDLAIKQEDFEWIAANTKGNAVDCNPRPIDPESVIELLQKAW